MSNTPKKAKKHSHDPPVTEPHSPDTLLSNQGLTRRSHGKSETPSKPTPARPVTPTEDTADTEEDDLLEQVESGDATDPRLIKAVSAKVNQITGDLHAARDQLKQATAQFEGDLSKMATEHAKELQKLIAKHASQIAAFRRSQEETLKVWCLHSDLLESSDVCNVTHCNVCLYVCMCQFVCVDVSKCLAFLRKALTVRELLLGRGWNNKCNYISNVFKH